MLLSKSNFNDSIIFGTMKICFRHGYFKPLSVNHSAREGREYGQLRDSFSVFYKIMVCLVY